MAAQQPTPAVYIVGSSGAGKSTLAKALADRLGWWYVPLSAGAAYARHGATFASAEADPELLRKIQTDICSDAVDTIRAALDDGAPFVTDRAIDYAVYTVLLCDPPPQAHAAAEQLRNWMVYDGATVLFCRPVTEILAAACLSDNDRATQAGGARSKFLSTPWVHRVDGGVLTLLRHRRIPFVEITQADRKQRLDAATSAVFERLTGVKFAEFRADGWPNCPRCGQDELHNSPIWTGMERPPLTAFIAQGLTCYQCNWKFHPNADPKSP